MAVKRMSATAHPINAAANKRNMPHPHPNALAAAVVTIAPRNAFHHNSVIILLFLRISLRGRATRPQAPAQGLSERLYV